MNHSPNEATLIAYLYNELGEEEKRRVEEFLSENPDARRDLQKLLLTRQILGQLDDKEVIAPPLVISESSHRLWQAPYVKTIVGMAASIIIVILIGKLSGLQVAYEDSRLTLDFGTGAKSAGALTANEVQGMINVSLQQNNRLLQGAWDDAHRDLAESIRVGLTNDEGMINNRITELVRQASMASKDQIRLYAASLQQQNRESLRDYMQLTTSEQKEYLETLLLDFAKYLQTQRNDDIRMMQTQLNGMEENNTQFRKDTEQLLSGIISAVSNSEANTQRN